jgi:hypothetical protein
MKSGEICIKQERSLQNNVQKGKEIIKDFLFEGKEEQQLQVQ